MLICHKLTELCYCFKGLLFENGIVAVNVIKEFGLAYHIADIDKASVAGCLFTEFVYFSVFVNIKHTESLTGIIC